MAGKIPDSVKVGITPHHSRMPVFFYGLPKDHKKGTSLRPVVWTCGGPIYNLSALSEHILNQLLQLAPFHLSSTERCVELLKSVGDVDSELIVASLDVVTLYTNVPIVDGVEVVVSLLREHRDGVDMFDLSGIVAVRFAVYFQFHNVVYRQVRGLAMGNNLAPPLAIIFMSQLECCAMESFPVKPKLYRRYIDDSILLWQHEMSSLMKFVSHLSSQHSAIEFTVQHSRPGVTSAVPYLDLSISVTDGRLEWELFVKESHSGVHLSYCSGLCMDVKMAVARNQFCRANINSSNERMLRRLVEKIEKLAAGEWLPYGNGKEGEESPKRK